MAFSANPYVQDLQSGLSFALRPFQAAIAPKTTKTIATSFQKSGATAPTLAPRERSAVKLRR